jgi:hypothetical protein
MRCFIFLNAVFFTLICQTRQESNSPGQPKEYGHSKIITHELLRPLAYSPDSWPYFLQHLPTEDKPILDFRGNLVQNQEKHFAILAYDVGSTDLQQCADALIRLRSEYLFSRKKYAQIGFYFNSGLHYYWIDYLKGMRPVFRNGQQVLAKTNSTTEPTHACLRKWLDIVYTYANTVSLCKELKTAGGLQTGTVIIFPGHPGHCCMIVDEALTDKQDTLYKIAEGYMPAQSIYILSNPYEPEWNPWYHLGKTDINTASCNFRSYYLKKFE